MQLNHLQFLLGYEAGYLLPCQQQFLMSRSPIKTEAELEEHLDLFENRQSNLKSLQFPIQFLQEILNELWELIWSQYISLLPVDHYLQIQNFHGRQE